jgi:hypothetical protein
MIHTILLIPLRYVMEYSLKLGVRGKISIITMVSVSSAFSPLLTIDAQATRHKTNIKSIKIHETYADIRPLVVKTQCRQ